MRIRIETLGCRLNLGEMDSLSRELVRMGHVVVPAGEEAELCVLNTCTVTGIASKKSRQALRKLKRELPGARLVVTGCFAELSPESCAELGADLVVPNDTKDRLAQILAGKGLLDSPAGRPTECAAPRHTRVFLKVQDGCDNHCTYCVVTLARGPGRSRPLQEILSEIHELEKNGFREIVLTGVHLASWGMDFKAGRRLGDLVEAILERTEIERIRLSSLEPWDLEAEFFDLFENPRLMPHLHLPLQSGSERILRRMARHMTPDAYHQLLEAARARIGDVAISTDVIVGFPGETETEFEESLDFIQSMEFSRIHVFRFSPREGTAAARMSGRIDGKTMSRRAGILARHARATRENFESAFIGRKQPVLWESGKAGDQHRIWSGLTPHYIRVTTSAAQDIDLFNRITPVRLLRLGGEGLEAELCST